jgi:hypothetical protein
VILWISADGQLALHSRFPGWYVRARASVMLLGAATLYWRLRWLCRLNRTGGGRSPCQHRGYRAVARLALEREYGCRSVQASVVTPLRASCWPEGRCVDLRPMLGQYMPHQLSLTRAIACWK